MLFLLLHYEMGHWDFPKGRIEPKESETETVIREIMEETGIEKVSFHEGFKESINYKYLFNGDKISKKVVFYLAETSKEDIKLSIEHKNSKWLPFEKALQQLTFDNAKEVLIKANEVISSRITE